MSVITHNNKVVVSGGRALSFDNLIELANSTTGETDTTLTDAVQRLVDGYGQGGGGIELITGRAYIVNQATKINIGKPYNSIVWHSHIQNLPTTGSNYTVEYLSITDSCDGGLPLSVSLRYNPGTGGFTYSSNTGTLANFDPQNGLVPIGGGSGYSPHNTDEWIWEAIILS